MQRLGLAIVFWLLVAFTAASQQAVPDFRYLVTQDMDFYGADLDAQFDTDLASCTRACSANAQCAAFTFNARSKACFPKSGVSERTAYTGALSAEKIATKPEFLENAPDLRQSLSFLPDEDFAQAARLARNLGFAHPAGGLDLNAILDAARAREATGDTLQAAGWIGAAVSLSDRADLWADYGRLLLRLGVETRDQGRQYENQAVSAAINAYLREATPGARASALIILSQALERVDRGRDMIPTLRLAKTLGPRDDIDVALTNAVAKYGFRVTDTSVESDSAAPRICAEFSEPLVKAGIDYNTYVRLPDPALVVQTDGTQLCVDGVGHGTRYRITLRSGLPAASGEILSKDVELTQYVRDRKPTVRFPGRAYVLPKSPGAALPVETVNLATIDLQLRRVSDRNLLRTVQDGFFGRPLAQWQDQQFSSEIAQEVWTGTADVANDLNRDMTTRLPLDAAIAGQPAGIYALTARVPGANPYDEPGATQWFVLSDLGLSAMSGDDGLHVFVRGLNDAKARAGIAVTLVSQANAVLADAVTDADGHAMFDPGLTRGIGGATPALVLAQSSDTDIGFLSLTDPAFDLSDRGVEGRAPSGPVDVFLTTDRGAYRAGETVHATVLSRDTAAQAITDLPLVAVLTRPDGVEYLRLVSDGGRAGGHVFSLPVGLSAPRGTWRLDIKADPVAPALASQTLLIEDFLPERIDFDLSLPDAPVRAGQTADLEIDARYLFGAPGADLTIEGQVAVQATGRIASWPGYRFGRYDADVSARSSSFGGQRTDTRGKATVALDLPTPTSVGQPMEAVVTARLTDGSGRPVERQLTVPLQPDAPLIGIKPLFDDVISEGGSAGFEVIALAPDLSQMPMQIRWTLNRVETRYQWYQLYGNWNWEPTTRRTRIATGTADLGDAPLALTQPVEWGRYELVIERLDGEYTAAAIDFHVGWYASADSSTTPDRLEVSLDKPTYRVGETAQVRIVPRTAGTAIVSVMSDRLIERRTLQVAEGATQIALDVTEDWGTGAYVMATVIRPMDVAAGQNPTRALGLAYATIDPADKQLSVSLEMPDVVRPRQTQRIGILVKDATPDDEIWVTLAAVDAGILNLTGFQDPDPSTYYFGRKRLGMDLRDVYGRLIDGMNGALGTVRSGGDAGAGMRMQSPPPTQDLMAAFSGPVQVGPDGKAFVDIALPAFNGTVRVMAVAWSRTAVGQASQDLLVRDPVVVTANVPRFLAPGDTSQLRFEVVHVDGPAGDMQFALEQTGTALDLGPTPATITVENHGKVLVETTVSAQSNGDPKFDIVLTTPDGTVLRQTLTLPVRLNDPVVAQTRRFSLASGDSFAFTDDVFADLRAGSGRAVLSAGPQARFDAPGLLTALDRYPYGCTEQVASQAVPLLYLSSVARASGLGDEAAIKTRVDAAIAQVLNRQAPNGAFGLWRAESGDFWLDAHASDFLSRAKAEGYRVADTAFRLAMDNLRNRINYAPDFDRGGEDIAYALMVLAREGAAAMGDLRYYADVKGDAFGSPLAAAQLGSALAAYGDQTRADAMFRRAARMVADSPDDPPVWRADYGTRLRDAAGVLALATEAGSTAIDADRLSTLVGNAGNTLSTQESAWTLLAAHALVRSPEQSGLRVNGAPVAGPFVQVLEDGTTEQAIDITSATGEAIDITLTTLGIPRVPPPAGGTGYGIERSYYTLKGDPLDGQSFKVGDRFVTVLKVTPFTPSEARLMVDDPLPAGIEIDNPSLLRSGDLRALDWLDLSEATHAEFRSDRFLAAVDLRQGGPVTLAYVARAITPGAFHHPAASVEDMYRPRYRARTASGRLLVTQ